MARRKEIEEMDREVKKILSISLPAELYQFLLEKSGKGNVGSFIREAIEEKIRKAENSLVNAYELLEKNKEYEDIVFQEIWERREIEKQENNGKPKQRKQNTK